MPDFVLTIGHSNHTMEKFIELVKAHAVTAIADVRSHPFSRFNPQFNRERLQFDLKKEGLAYVFLGEELGARPENPNCYLDGTVQYDRLAQTPLFRKGLSRVVAGSRTHRIALMCAEKDPLTCHRAILVCRYLIAQDVGARHILDDGRIETHDESLRRLLRELGMPDSDLFRSRDELIHDAYQQRGRQIAFTPQAPSREPAGRM